MCIAPVLPPSSGAATKKSDDQGRREAWERQCYPYLLLWGNGQAEPLGYVEANGSACMTN